VFFRSLRRYIPFLWQEKDENAVSIEHRYEVVPPFDAGIPVHVGKILRARRLTIAVPHLWQMLTKHWQADSGEYAAHQLKQGTRRGSHPHLAWVGCRVLWFECRINRASLFSDAATWSVDPARAARGTHHWPPEVCRGLFLRWDR